MTRRVWDGKTIYGITSEELHANIIADLKKMAQHHQVDCSRIWEREQERPIEQTIRMVIRAFENQPVRDGF